ncbi:MAG TPA: efflux transporter outer membrane subunit [Steroidobacteraceae bacterium]|nr:efflux transporter outer membrane subunit [Steroidobacteraceae bacterium]
MRPLRSALLGAGMPLVAACLVAACAVGPNYKRPAFHTAPGYKEENGWKPTEPADAMSRGPWWKIFNDEVLDQLEAKIEVSNENVKAALAAYDQAKALVDQSRAGLWPTATANLSRIRSAQHGLGAISAGGVTTLNTSGETVTTNTVGVGVNWPLDIWGQIRRTVESNKASWQSSAAALAAAKLSAQATLATDYFELRAQDQLEKLLDDTVIAEQLSLKITESRYRYGVAAKADVVSAEAQLLSSQAQQINAKIQRAVLEHAIAVLVGAQPAELSVSPTAMRTDVPTVPAGIPSALLERRPDVAEAERKMAAANAQIGVAKAAYFPTLTLSGSDQYTSTMWSHLISLPNRAWSLGPSLAETIFDAGARGAEVRGARAAYEANVATYRQTVLSGFQQVEDEIATLRILEQQAVVEEQAVKAAREAELLTLNQYKAGTVPYSSVITAQTTRLAAEETALTVLSSRLQASVALIEALGGGWSAEQLPR